MKIQLRHCYFNFEIHKAPAVAKRKVNLSYRTNGRFELRNYSGMTVAISPAANKEERVKTHTERSEETEKRRCPAFGQSLQRANAEDLQ